MTRNLSQCSMPRGLQQHTAPAPAILAAMPPSRHFAAMAILGEVCSLRFQNLKIGVQLAKFLVARYQMANKMTKEQQTRHLQSQAARKTMIEERDAARAEVPKSRYPALDSSDNDAAPFSSGGAAAVSGSNPPTINSSTPTDIVEDASLGEGEEGPGEKLKWL
jgi:hypothetical protein